MKIIKWLSSVLLGTSILILITTFFPSLYTPSNRLTTELKQIEIEKDFKTILEKAGIENQLFANIIKKQDFDNQTASKVIQKRAKDQLAANSKVDPVVNLTNEEIAMLSTQVQTIYDNYLMPINISNIMCQIQLCSLITTLISAVSLIFIKWRKHIKN